MCPNCHAFTNNYRGKNKQRIVNVTEEEFVQALSSAVNIRQALISLGLAPKGDNYSRAYKLINKYNITHLQ